MKRNRIITYMLCFVMVLTLAGSIFGYTRVKAIEAQYEASNEAKADLVSAYVRQPEPESSPEVKQPEETKEPAVEQDKEPEEVKAPAMMVDFEGLNAVCGFGSVAGWLYGENTQMNYPVVQCPDNYYYLHRLIDGSDNFCGTLYTDCRSDRDFTGRNTIIYGHNMKNGSMFGELELYLADRYYADYPSMYLFTPTFDYRVDIISAFTTVTTNEWLWQQQFETDMDYQEYLNHVMESNQIPGGTNVSVSTDDKIITMVTCAYATDNSRTIVVGKLVEIS